MSNRIVSDRETIWRVGVPVVVILLLVALVRVASYAQGSSLFCQYTFHPFTAHPDGDPPSLAENWSAPQWTPDGASIVFATNRNRSSSDQAFIVASDGSGRFSAVGDSEFARSTVAISRHGVEISPDGSRILYSRLAQNRDGDPVAHIETSALDGSDRSRLTDRPDGDYAPSFSPDGEYIAFNRSGDNRCRFLVFADRPTGLYVSKSDGSGVRKIVSSPPVMRNPGPAAEQWQQVAYVSGGPRWSSDGRLAFASGGSVYTVNSNGSDLTRVFAPASSRLIASNIAWSPDGLRLAFVAQVRGTLRLYTMRRDGSDLRQTGSYSWSLPKHGSVSWSPDGSRILFSVHEDLYVVDAEGSNPRRVGLGSRSAWSPDGSRIAAVTFEDDCSHAVLYTMAADGSDIRILVRKEYNGSLQARGPEERPSVPDSAACSAGVVVPDPEANLGLVSDCEALVEMTDIVWPIGTGPNWNASAPIVDWQGVTLGDPLAAEDDDDSAEPLMPLRIRGLSLAEYEQLGIDPAQVARLPELRSLALTLRGPIPLEFGGLANLQKLSIHGGVGPIPSWLANLENLQELRLSGVGVAGPIPPELGRLSELRILDIHETSVSGTIPVELGNLTALEILDIRYTPIKGPIPRELGGLPALKKLRVEGVHLSGCIPQGLRGKIDGVPRDDTNVPIKLCEQ